MVKVYFETNNGYAELVATFEYESDYIECFSILKKQCEIRGFDKITESIGN